MPPCLMRRPASGTVSRLPATSMRRSAARASGAVVCVVVNVTFTVQLPAGASDPQVLVCAKSSGVRPAMVIPATVSVVVPVFVSVTCWGRLVTPGFVVWKSSDSGAMVRPGVTASAFSASPPVVAAVPAARWPACRAAAASRCSCVIFMVLRFLTSSSVRGFAA